ncbi:MAG: hypothetical protein M3440_06690 [Chloroflexota bacterium]|nr:hypothetical protein [Chloroflexota bacterium]
MNREPLLSVGSIVAIIAAVLVFLKSFGVDITDSQQEAVRNLVAVLAPIILAFIARQFVYSPNSVETIATDQYNAGVPPTEPQPEIPPPAAVN